MPQDLTKYDVKKLKDTEIMRIYKEEIKKGITTNSEQQNNQNEETSEIYYFSPCIAIQLYNINQKNAPFLN